MNTSPSKARSEDEPQPKLCGTDMELGNFIQGLEVANGGAGSGYAASRALLREIEGVPNRQSRWPLIRNDQFDLEDYLASGGAWQSNASSSSQDWGRKFLPNGSCFYIDLNHLEVCLPEVMSAYDHLAYCHALFRLTQGAMRRVNEQLPDGLTVKVTANNSDGRSNSYGAHLNFLIALRTWNNIFHWKLHHLLFLATYQVSSIVFTGQGKVGAENRTPAVPYQISQRADFIETLTALQTTFCRPIVNSRNEPICGDHLSFREPSPAAHLARLHVIFYDNNLCHVAALLKVGVLQIILAMMERERIPTKWLLDNPVQTVVRWSHDPTLQTTAPLVNGERYTAVETQLQLCEAAAAFVAEGGCDGIVPHAREILALWQDTLNLLHRRDFAALSPRLDWVLKWRLLLQAAEHRKLSWAGAELQYLDQIYASLDPREGLFWRLERSGQVQRCVAEEQIQQCLQSPPENTRAWTRSQLLQRFPDEIEEMDWDYFQFRLWDGRWPRLRSLHLADPLAFTKEATAGIWSGEPDLEATLDALGAPPTAASTADQSLLPYPSKADPWPPAAPIIIQQPLSAAARSTVENPHRRGANPPKG